MRKWLVIILTCALSLAVWSAAMADDLLDRYVMGQPMSGEPVSLLDDGGVLSPRAYGLDGSDYLWNKWLESQENNSADKIWLRNNLSNFLSRWGYLDTVDTPKVRLPLGGDKVVLALGLDSKDSSLLALPPNVSRDDVRQTPGLGLALELNAGALQTSPGFGWRGVDSDEVPNGYDNSYNSWVAYLPVEYSVGGLTAKAGAYMGENIDSGTGGGSEYFAFQGPSSAPLWTEDGKVSNTMVYGGFLALEYNLGPWSVTGGAGAVYTANEAWTRALAYRTDNYVRKAYFFALPYRVGRRFVVQPELSYFDNGVDPKDGTELKDDWLLGVNMRFSF